MGVTKHFIDVVIKDGQDWRFTGIYGERSREQKDLTCNALRSLHANMSLPWLVLGEFNEILFNFEKEGERPFSDAMGDCGLSDLGYEEDMFTWQRGKIRERLDRGVANTAWNSLFPNAKLTNSEMTKSDHRPLVVETEPGAEPYQRGQGKKFEARWLKEETVQ